MSLRPLPDRSKKSVRDTLSIFGMGDACGMFGWSRTRVFAQRITGIFSRAGVKKKTPPKTAATQTVSPQIEQIERAQAKKDSKRRNPVQPRKQPSGPVIRPDPLFEQIKQTKEPSQVSIHKEILSGIRKAVRQGIQNEAKQRLGILPGVIGGVAAVGGRVLPAIGRVVLGRTAGAAGLGVLLGQTLGGDGAGGACPSGWHLNKQEGKGGAAGTYCVRNRRTNFGNAHAARRSVRRLKGARKLLKDIEKMMPTRSSRRRAPAGHSTQLTHTGAN